MGSWLLFVPPETGALTGSLGVLGYSISVFLPFAFMSVAGPVVKSALGSGSRGFTLSCFIREYVGRQRCGLPTSHVSTDVSSVQALRKSCSAGGNGRFCLFYVYLFMY